MDVVDDLDPRINEAIDSVLWRLAENVEARNVARRADMSAAQRRRSLPESTEDVPRDQQIVGDEQLLQEMIKAIRGVDPECPGKEGAEVAARLLLRG